MFEAADKHAMKRLSYKDFSNALKSLDELDFSHEQVREREENEKRRGGKGKRKRRKEIEKVSKNYFSSLSLERNFREKLYS